jgi:septum formation protein
VGEGTFILTHLIGRVHFQVLQLPFPVILASASPRRKELLSQIISDFEIIAPNVDEDSVQAADPHSLAKTLAEMKGRAVAANHPQHLVIAADTVVAFEQDGVFTYLSKPASHAEAVEMLRALSGREHIVVTGVALLLQGRTQIFSSETRVRFRDLTGSEIAEYVVSGEPMDKAGAYAIQGGATAFVESAEGSYTNVVGLPVDQLLLEVQDF